MGAKSKIEWCDSTWNPITGCLHGCEYCYARRIAHRFGGLSPDDKCHELEELNRDAKGKPDPYPFGFAPTFHRYLLNKPQYWEKPRNIFVGSMADMWGKWVPNDWKIEVIEACKKAPQHNYLFLTKDPAGYSIWPTEKHPDFKETHERTDNIWLGITYTGTERHRHDEWEVGGHLTKWANFWYLWRMGGCITPGRHHNFLSIEPLKNDICENEDERNGGKLLENFLKPNSFGTPSKFFEWVIVGAETGNRKGKIKPEKEWVDKIVELCSRDNIPIFMKESLLPIMGEESMRRELPEQLRRQA